MSDRQVISWSERKIFSRVLCKLVDMEPSEREITSSYRAFCATIGLIFPDPMSRKKMRSQKREQTLDALKKNDWHQARAAKDLGISQGTISLRIKMWGIKKNCPD